MPETISRQLDEMFHEASIAFVRKLLTSDRDLAALEAINQSAHQKRDELTRLYREEYSTRVDTERQRLYDKAAQLRLDHLAPPGVPTTSDDTITRQAHRAVRLAHEADLQRTRDEAQQGFEDLLDQAHRRNQTKGLATAAFLRATDRRSEQDRRIRNQSQD